jgi:HEPN domain-containing protein
MTIMRPETQAWWKQGLADIQTAKVNLKAEKFYAAAFFAQQAAEKALKAVFLESLKRTPPALHNLYELGKSVRAPANILETCRDISPAYTLARYPSASTGSPSEFYTEKNAKEAVDKSSKVIAWVKRSLNL